MPSDVESPSYLFTKQRVAALAPDDSLVLLATALDLEPRPIRTAAVLTAAAAKSIEGEPFRPADVAAITKRLGEQELLVQRRGYFAAPLEQAAYLSMAAYARAPQVGQALATELHRLHGYQNPATNKASAKPTYRYRDWDFSFDYEAFPHKALLLALGGKADEFQTELKNLRSHHEWRVPERKAEALRLALEPLRHFDYGVFKHLDPSFRNTALEYAATLNGDWNATTATEIAAALTDAEWDGRSDSPYDEAVAGFGASLALHAFREAADAVAPAALYPPSPRIELILAAGLRNDAEELLRLAEAVHPLEDDAAGMGDIIAGLVRLRQNPTHARSLVEQVRRWKESPVVGVTEAFGAYVHIRAGNVDHGERILRDTFAKRRAPLAWAVALCVYAWAGLKPNPDSIDALAAELELAEDSAEGMGIGVSAGDVELSAAESATQLGETEDGADTSVLTAPADVLTELAAFAPPLAYQPYVRAELANALAHVLPGDPRAAGWRKQADAIVARYKLHYLLRLQPVPEPWEYTLRIIDSVADAGANADTTDEDTSETRILWVVDFEEQSVTAREQKRGKRGWSRGRKVSTVDLVEHAGSGAFDAADEKVIGSITGADGRPVALGRRYGHDLNLEFGRSLYHLNGHPRLVLDDAKRIPLELRRAKPVLTIGEVAPTKSTDTDNGVESSAETDEDQPASLQLTFSPAGASAGGYHYEKETPTRYRVYELSAEQARLSRAIGRATVIPGSQRDSLERRIADLRKQVTVVSATEAEAGDFEEIHGDTRPCAQLLPYGVAYKLELYARPLQGEEVYLRIGDGQPRSILERDGGMLKVDGVVQGEATSGTKSSNGAEVLAEAEETSKNFLLLRDLEAESRAAEEMISDCPTLQQLGHRDYEWTLDNDLVALQVLLELRALQQDGRISVEHPKGEKLRLIATANAQDLKMQIRKERDWFEVSGKLTADESTVVSFRKLLEHVRSGGGTFVELSEGEFVAITAELRARLEAMEGMLQDKAGGATALPTLAAPAFAELAEDLDDLEVDDAWLQNLARIRETADFSPAVPANFDAELRDYQVVGYQWLRRLAEWRVGGCLADDMGLGKTVQALALLTARANLGPALVIAPASVTRNWVSETKRFAPSIRPKLLATSGDTKLVEELEAGDLLIVSYGLLGFVEDALQQIHFSTIVLDEAQAIKNPATKRAKLIFGLIGDLRLATTGTPIENHLGELWSLFRFLNPGLLGSRRSFNEKYAGPIRRDDDLARAEQLRRMVRPFVLRRRKEEVLTELPPKTEVNLTVELSEGERALYEALRRQAVEEIETSNVQQRRFQVLRQLTRLRQAACNPRLVRPESKLPSAKLDLVAQTVRELLENGHRALIFSQFVKHLKLVEAWVQSEGLTYCYLDGSTPGGKRQQEVDRFQAGEADVFLISLKAGGTGLNLTAADYVLHLDPWWNPAAEDQASDRAHRIGQERPVTVYRFVSAGTIEEQILALHAEKRGLADQILAGTDVGGKLSVDEVVNLIAG